MTTTETNQPVESAEAPRVRQKRPTQTYVRTNKPRPDRLTGQGLQVLEAIEALNCPFNSEDIVEKTQGQFKTRQPDDRIVAYYLAKFKRSGLLVTEGARLPATEEEQVVEEGEAE